MKRTLLITLLMLLVSVPAYANDCGAYCSVDFEIELETSEPNVTPLTPNTDLMYDRSYYRVDGRVQVYDAPNGNPTRIIEPGFNFVTILTVVDGWVQINGNEWIQSEFTANSNGVVSSYTGILLPEEGLEYPMAWVLVNMYPSPAPGANPSEQFDFLPRYTRVNIYNTVEVDGENWYMVGPQQWVHQFNVAKLNPLTEIPDSVDTDIWVSINLYEQIVVAYEGTTPVFATLTSTGLPRWPTYEGTFNIYFRNPREYMSWGTVGDDFYSLEEVPWTMFFDEGRALHGAYWHDGFGYRRSHGCVNLSITDARWLYDWVSDYMGSNRSADYEVGPAVYVYTTGEYTQ
ncbi:MAG: L,D-transpeptidase [Chloroflexota bacterium]